MDENSKRTVLVVEDDREIRHRMSEILHARGHHVVLAVDAGEAMKTAERHQPAIILTDVDLPTLNSMMLQIRRHPDLKDLSVAVIDLNEPEIDPAYRVNVLGDFDQLDALIASLPISPEPDGRE